MLQVLLIFTVLSCSKKSDEIEAPQPDASKNLDFGVIISPEAYLRIAPFVFSSKIYDLVKGNTVRIIGKSTEKVVLGKNNDYWYRVIIDNGMIGWLYGANLSIVSGEQDKKVNLMLEEMKEQEIEKLYSELLGKWWSINKAGNYTNRVLEIHPDKKYRAYFSDREERAKEGEYSINYEDSELVLSEGSPYNAKITYLRKGLSYELTGHISNSSFGFVLISKTIDPKDDPKDFEEENKQDATETQ